MLTVVSIVTLFFITTDGDYFYLICHGMLVFISIIGTLIAGDKFILVLLTLNPDERAALGLESR